MPPEVEPPTADNANFCEEHQLDLKFCLDELGYLLHWCTKGMVNCRLTWSHRPDKTESVV